MSQRIAAAFGGLAIVAASLALMSARRDGLPRAREDEPGKAKADAPPKR